MAGQNRANEQTSTLEPHSGIQAKEALAAFKGAKTLTKFAEQCDIHPNQITQWKGQLQEGAPVVFGEVRAD
jgi:hypothetical protein